MNYRKFVLGCFGSLLLILSSPAQSWQWAKTSKQAFEDFYPSKAQGKTVCVDNVGNVYVVGLYKDVLDFGFNDDPNDEESFFEPDFESGSGAFLLKYSPQGNLLLVQKLGTVANVNKAVLDFSGKFLYVVGSFFDSASFAGKPLNNFLNFAQTFVAKIDVSLPQPQAVWATTIGSDLKDPDSASLAVDFSGNCYVSSQFSGLLNLTQNFFFAAGNNTDVYVARLRSDNGLADWADVISGMDADLDDVSQDINFSFSSGNIYLVASYRGSSVKILSANTEMKANGDQGYVVVKYTGSSSGANKPKFTWATTIGSDSGVLNFETHLVADERNQNVIIAGEYLANTPLLFDDAKVAADDVNPNNFSPNQNTFLASLKTVDGSLKWIKRATSPVKSGRIVSNEGLAVDKVGGIYVTGWATSVNGGMNFVQFDDAPPLNLTSFLAKVYHVKYDKNGIFQWQLLSASGTPNEIEVFTGTHSHDIAVDTNFNIYSTGEFSGTDVIFAPVPTLQLTGEDNSQQTCIWTGRLKQP